jgi:RNA polymerase subunit RPABC4/transcription elongation factor Spt4
MRKVIAEAAARRNSITEGCASGSREAGKLSTDASKVGFRTKAEEDDANDRAIAQALRELMEEEEIGKLDELYAPRGTGGLAWDRENGLSFDDDRPSREASPGLSWSKENGLTLPPARPLSRLVTDAPKRTSSSSTTSSINPSRPQSRLIAENERRRSKALPAPPPLEQPLPPVSSSDPDKWACPQCTLLNPLDFLSCEVCGLEQPPQPIPRNKRYGPARAPALPKAPPAAKTLRGETATPFEPAKGRLGWNCLNCGTFMEHQWWTCSLCGTMKAES